MRQVTRARQSKVDQVVLHLTVHIVFKFEIIECSNIYSSVLRDKLATHLLLAMCVSDFDTLTRLLCTGNCDKYELLFSDWIVGYRTLIDIRSFSLSRFCERIRLVTILIFQLS